MLIHYIIDQPEQLSLVHRHFEHTDPTNQVTVLAYYDMQGLRLQDVYIDQPWNIVHEVLSDLIISLTGPINLIVCSAKMIDCVCPEEEDIDD